MEVTIDQALLKAVDHHRSGRLQEAEMLYRAIIQAQPNNPDANHNLGVLAVSIGKPLDAIPFFRSALSAFPYQPQFWVSLIEALQKMGDHGLVLKTLAEARSKGIQHHILDKLEAKIVGAQGYASQTRNLSLPYSERRKLEIAKKKAKTRQGSTSDLLKAAEPSQLEIKAALGLYVAEKYPDAEQAAIELAQKFPKHPFGWKLLGAVQTRQGRKDSAVAAKIKAVHLDPNDAESHSNLGNALKEVGRLEEAATSCLEAIRINASLAEAHSNLGSVLKELGRLKDAESSCREAIRLKPSLAEARYNLGITVYELGRLEESEAAYREAIQIRPDYPEAHSNLAVVLRVRGRLEEAEACCREAIRIKSDFAEAHCNLGLVLRDIGYLQESEASYREALRIKPDYFEAYSNLLFLLSYVEKTSPADYLQEAAKFGHLVSEKIIEKFTAWPLVRKPVKLRVGLVSSDFRNHPVGYFIEGLCENLNPDRVELIAFSNCDREDELTMRIKPLFIEWHSIFGMNDQKASHAIHGSNINVLVDLSGHTAKNRLAVFAKKPAPIQVNWLGYWASTGVSEIDYLLGDPYVTPPAESSHFSEEIWALPETYLCFSPPKLEIDVGPLPALANGYVTFGCFNNLSKIGKEVVELWSNVLHRVSDSRLFLKTHQLGEAALAEAVVCQFSAKGIAPERLVLEGPSSRVELLQAYNRVDIALDPFPYPGGTTTAEALWMGVPVLTKAGDRFLSHVGESIAYNAGQSDWIAQDDDAYVAKAVSFSSNPQALSEIRQGLRAQVLSSPLFDAPRFARHFEEAMWGMWSKYMNGDKS